MTAERGSARAERWLAPRTVFGALGALILLILLLSSEENLADDASSLTTYSYDGAGAHGLHDAARRLGWRVERREVPFAGTLDSTALYVLLAPPIQPTAGEVTALLDAVRRGAGLFFVPANGSPLSDSLRVRVANVTPRAAVGPVGRATRRPRTVARDSARRDSARWRPTIIDGITVGSRVALRKPPPPDTVTFLAAFGFAEQPVTLGFTLGRGRVVALADPILVRNRVVRTRGAGPHVLRALGWASPAPGARMVFAEYHQGFGVHANLTRAVWTALRDTPAGRAALQVGIAALALLLALGPRPIPPVSRTRIERRSPLEHVGALARAYEQIGATRLATRRLIAGLRRRHPLGAARAGDDEQYLGALKSRYRQLAPDVDLLVAASARQLPPAEFARVARAIANIERTIQS
ncbi:MAG: DUF4350 domain-containing protein [Gemmatimonadaceae bacterium]